MPLLSFLESLPQELTVATLDKLSDLKDFAAISQTSKALNGIAHDECLWKNRYQIYFGAKLPTGAGDYTHAAFTQRAQEVKQAITRWGLLWGDKVILKKLLSHGYNDNLPLLTKPAFALSALSHAGFLLGVNQLLEIEAVRENAAAMNNWALIEAAHNGHLDVINRLLEIEAVRENAAAENNYALRWAAENGHLDVVKRLLEIEAVRESAAALDNYALNTAAKNGHLAVVNRLLEIEAVRENTAKNNNRALRWATGYGHLDVVNRLLEIEVVRENAAALDNYALRWAAENGHLDVVNRLLEIDSVRSLVLSDTSEKYTQDIVETALSTQLRLSLESSSSITHSFKSKRDDENDNAENIKPRTGLSICLMS